MPLYDFVCQCGERFDRMVKLADFEEPQFGACGLPARRVISAPRISVENVGYDCPITGKWIGSKREHEENLKQHNCRVLETGETEQVKKFREAEEARFDAAVEETIEKQWEVMPSEKKEKLANELLGGADLAVERK